MNRRLFRIFLLASIVFGVVGAAIDLILPSLIPEPLRAAQESIDAETSNTFVFVAAGCGLALLAALAASYVGLYRFRNWGRVWAVCITLVAVVATPFLGAWSQSGVSVALTEVATTLWGAVLAAAYFSPVASEFARSDA
jgi:ABC-type multidrug transport system fused ATPase/permease subunit